MLSDRYRYGLRSLIIETIFHDLLFLIKSQKETIFLNTQMLSFLLHIFMGDILEQNTWNKVIHKNKCYTS